MTASLVLSGALLLELTLLLGFFGYRLRRSEQRARAIAEAAGKDLADRKRAESLYRCLVRNLPNTSVCLFDRNLRHLVADGILVTQTIPPHQSVEGLTLAEVFPGDMADILLPYYQAVLGGTPCQTEQHFRTRTYRITFLPIEGDDNVVEMGMVVFVDITDERANIEALKERSSDLERSNRDLEQFANVASHELKSPLRRISSFAELLRADHADALGAEGLEYFRHIVEGVENLRQVIESLLTYARVQVGPARSRMETVDMTEVVREVARDIGWLLTERHCRVAIYGLPKVFGDRVLLKQLVENLITNAVKFNTTKRRPQVAIRAKRDLLFWEFRVSDNGPGIDPALKDRVFVMFQRFQPEVEGSGIGLALCKKIVGIHRGQIWVESDPGKGTTFFFTLQAQRK